MKNTFLAVWVGFQILGRVASLASDDVQLPQVSDPSLYTISSDASRIALILDQAIEVRKSDGSLVISIPNTWSYPLRLPVFSPDLSLLAFEETKVRQFYVVSLKTGTTLLKAEGLCPVFTPDSKSVITLQSKLPEGFPSYRLVPVQIDLSGGVLKEYQVMDRKMAETLHFSRDGKRFFTKSKGQEYEQFAWDRESGKQTGYFGFDSFPSIADLRDYTHTMYDQKRTHVKIVDYDLNRQWDWTVGEYDSFSSIATAPDGRSFVATHFYYVQATDPRVPPELPRLTVRDEQGKVIGDPLFLEKDRKTNFTWLQFSADSQTLLVIQGPEIYFWNLKSRGMTRINRGNQPAIKRAYFLEGGNTILAYNQKNQLEILSFDPPK